MDVVFNEKAWTNEQTMLHWIKRCCCPASEYNISEEEPRLLALDAFKARKMDEV